MEMQRVNLDMYMIKCITLYPTMKDTTLHYDWYLNRQTKYPAEKISKTKTNVRKIILKYTKVLYSHMCGYSRNESISIFPNTTSS